MTASVYVICERDTLSPVKIGWAVSPRGRLCHLQIGNPRKLELFHARVCESAEAARATESAAHRELRHAAMAGEWFSVDAPTAAAIVDAVVVGGVDRTETQSSRIIDRFPSQQSLADFVGLKQSAIANWKARGFIPTKHHQRVLDAAKRLKVKLSPKDFFSEAAE